MLHQVRVVSGPEAPDTSRFRGSVLNQQRMPDFPLKIVPDQFGAGIEYFRQCIGAVGCDRHCLKHFDQAGPVVHLLFQLGIGTVEVFFCQYFCRDIATVNVDIARVAYRNEFEGIGSIAQRQFQAFASA